jgi:putative transposase
MKKSKFTRAADRVCAPASGERNTGWRVCRKMGISEATFYRWKQLYGGLMPSEVKKLRQLEEENTRLRRVVVDLTTLPCHYSPP